MCVFCDIAKGCAGAHIIYQNQSVTCFLDSDPINEGHMLIIPNEHYLDADALPTEVANEIMQISQRCVSVIKAVYDCDGYSIMQNGGQFNDAGHYHMHIFPRFQGDGFGWTYSDHTALSDESVKQKIISVFMDHLYE